MRLPAGAGCGSGCRRATPGRYRSLRHRESAKDGRKKFRWNVYSRLSPEWMMPGLSPTGMVSADPESPACVSIEWSSCSVTTRGSFPVPDGRAGDLFRPSWQRPSRFISSISRMSGRPWTGTSLPTRQQSSKGGTLMKEGVLDASALHSATWAALGPYLTPELLAYMTTGPYRQAQYSDPVALMSQLPSSKANTAMFSC